MGATLTAVLVQETTAYIAQVGDSRAYLIRSDRIKQLTKDQSLVQMLVDSGAITEEQMDSVPQNVIMQALGTQPSVKVAMTAVQLYRNDRLVICSDGLSNKIGPDELRETVGGAEDLTETSRVLIERANERGGEDNITVIVARFDGESLHSASDGKSITGSFRALDQGYVSEYFSQNSMDREDNFQASSITGVLRVPQSDQLIIDDETVADPDFSSRTTADGLTYDEISRERAGLKRQSYAFIIIAALISLLLIAATGYFVYSFYLKQQPVPQNSEEPQ